jgi:uncharacterized membrane protein
MSFQLVSPVYAAPCGGSDFDLTQCFTLGIGQAPVSSVYDTPSSLINLLATNIFVFAGIVIFFTFAYAGFKMIQDEAKGKDEARDMFTKAVLGLVVMFVAYWVVQIIAVVTGANLGF